MMIEYSIEELKYYYNNNTNKYDDYTSDDIASINYLEDTVSDLIDRDHTNNSIYHLFPSVIGVASIIGITGIVFSSFICYF